jgi:hypothetical protein
MCAFCTSDASAGRARQTVLPTPPRSPHPRPLLPRQHRTPVTPLTTTLTNLPTSAANKRLTPKLTPLNATLTKNRGAGVALPLSTFLRSNVQRCNSFSVTSLAAPHLVTSIESHPYKNHGEGGRPYFPNALLSLFASRVFPNSFPIRIFHTLPQKLGGVTPPAIPIQERPPAAATSSPSFDVQTFKRSNVQTFHSLPLYFLTSFRRLIDSTCKC